MGKSRDDAKFGPIPGKLKFETLPLTPAPPLLVSAPPDSDVNLRNKKAVCDPAGTGPLHTGVPDSCCPRVSEGQQMPHQGHPSPSFYILGFLSEELNLTIPCEYREDSDSLSTNL